MLHVFISHACKKKTVKSIIPVIFSQTAQKDICPFSSDKKILKMHERFSTSVKGMFFARSSALWEDAIFQAVGDIY